MGTSFPFLLKQLHTVGAFGLYAGFNLVAFTMIFLWVPETMQRTLEELDFVFAVPVRKFAAYQLTETIPWFIKRNLLFQRDATRRPLYQFERFAVPPGKHAPGAEPFAASSDEDRKKF